MGLTTHGKLKFNGLVLLREREREREGGRESISEGALSIMMSFDGRQSSLSGPVGTAAKVFLE